MVSVWGTKITQLRGWPVNWFLELDPLVAIGNLLTVKALYKGLVWAILTIILTILLGRVFCGWICPFGSLHQFIGYIGNRLKTFSQRVHANQYHKAQTIKYYVLFAFLLIAFLPVNGYRSLQTGLLDPIPLIYRSINLILLNISDQGTHLFSVNPRYYEGSLSIGIVFVVFVLLNLWIPRFFCRFICPTGAFLGIISRYSLWRIGKNDPHCVECQLCENHCEGACEPFEKIRISECVMCLNCLTACKQQAMAYQREKSASGEHTDPDLTRRGLLISLASGAVALPVIRATGVLANNWKSSVIRPPGALSEPEFLERCLKCGQCMKICPTNIIMPGGIDGGWENLWTPVLNFRIGTSGCQLNCVACGQVCPTAAIRPLTFEEKNGLGKYEKTGPVRMGTAFVDRNRCLPWAMERPCIVCQENCPVSPKAIFVKEDFQTVRGGEIVITSISDNKKIIIDRNDLIPNQYATGDFYLLSGENQFRIISNSTNNIQVETGDKKIAVGNAEIKVHLLQPVVDVNQCIGCGTCEHECPVSGLRAIRITAENETRNQNHSLFLRKG